MVNDMNKVGIFVTVFIAILIGITLLDVIADQVWQGTDGIYTVTNETLTLTEATAISLDNDWVTAITSVGLANGTVVPTANYTVTRLNSDDVTQITYYSEASANYSGNTSYVIYTYQDNNYVRDGSSRVLIGLVVIFFVLAILATAIWGMNKMGILDLLK